VPRLTDWKNDGISMFPNTAACAVLCGIALLLNRFAGERARPFARATALVAATIGGLTLCEHIAGVSLGIDTMLISRTWGQAAAAPGLAAAARHRTRARLDARSHSGARSRRHGLRDGAPDARRGHRVQRHPLVGRPHGRRARAGAARGRDGGPPPGATARGLRR